MVSEVDIYVSRAGNELRLAAALFGLSKNQKTKTDLGANSDDTFYSAVISHAYYSIFYAAKALLLTWGVKTKPPEIHRKTFDEFKERFVDTGILDVEANVPYAEESINNARKFVTNIGENKMPTEIMPPAIVAAVGFLGGLIRSYGRNGMSKNIDICQKNFTHMYLGCGDKLLKER